MPVTDAPCARRGRRGANCGRSKDVNALATEAVHSGRPAADHGVAATPLTLSIAAPPLTRMTNIYSA